MLSQAFKPLTTNIYNWHTSSNFRKMTRMWYKVAPRTCSWGQRWPTGDCVRPIAHPHKSYERGDQDRELHHGIVTLLVKIH